LRSMASSANRKGLEKCINDGMSFMYSRNNRGPRILPWGHT